MNHIVKTGCQQPTISIDSMPAYVGMQQVKCGIRTATTKQYAPITEEPAYLQHMRHRDPML